MSAFLRLRSVAEVSVSLSRVWHEVVILFSFGGSKGGKAKGGRGGGGRRGGGGEKRKGWPGINEVITNAPSGRSARAEGGGGSAGRGFMKTEMPLPTCWTLRDIKGHQGSCVACADHVLQCWRSFSWNDRSGSFCFVFKNHCAGNDQACKIMKMINRGRDGNRPSNWKLKRLPTARTSAVPTNNISQWDHWLTWDLLFSVNPHPFAFFRSSAPLPFAIRPRGSTLKAFVMHARGNKLGDG